jgi:hypothetical protein
LYQKRLETKQKRDIALWEKHCRNLEDFLALDGHEDIVDSLAISQRLEKAKAHLDKVKQASYLQSLEGTIGADTLEPCLET